jgi:hypothetical protein
MGYTCESNWISYNLGEVFIQAVKQLLLSLGLAHQCRHLFLQMADYVRMHFGGPRPLHKRARFTNSLI